MAFGIKVSKPGIDVKTAENKDTAFNTENKTFKVYRGLITTSATTVAHGLSYAPAYMYYVKTGTKWTLGAKGYGGEKEALVTIDATNVYTHTTSELYIILFIESLSG